MREYRATQEREGERERERKGEGEKKNTVFKKGNKMTMLHLLEGVLGLVVLREWDGVAGAAQHRTAVSGVGA